jgi:hypothetical protein
MPNPLGVKTSPAAQGFKIGQPDEKQLARFSFFSTSRALRISVITHSLWMLCPDTCMGGWSGC